MKTAFDTAHPASVTPLPIWSDLNRQWLVAEINRLRAHIEELALKPPHNRASVGYTLETEPSTSFTPALIHCAKAFGLSPFERQVLLLVAGLELDHGLRSAVATFNSGEFARASYGLALATLAQPHWDALSPDAPLRRWSIVEPKPGGILTQAALRIDERMLHFIAGVSASDTRLDGVAIRIDPPPRDDDHDNLPLALTMARLLAIDNKRHPIVVLHGAEHDAAARRDLALAIIACLARPALWIAASDLPHDAASLSLLARHIDREHALTGGLPILAVDSPADELAASGLAGRLRSAMLWLGTPGHGLAALPRHRPLSRFELPKSEARRLPAAVIAHWRRLAAPDAEHGAEIDAMLTRTAAQFHLAPALLEQIAERLSGAPAATHARQIWTTARELARGGLDALAQRITTRVTFADLVLPSGQSAVLKDIARQLRHRERVYRDWGFGEKHQLGQGLVALFAGESGTGKTLAAEAIASEVDLDLYRVDLATLVSKYIGETEKNLKRLFDAAETSGAVLLFDEADALFGKRSEVKDSHDRYANIEVAYLLQRVEAYRGLAVLTTNMKSALDRAFLRRIRFIVTFPFPDVAAREQIWRRQFPAAAPLGKIDFAALSHLNLAGGNIRSIVLNAAFKAADRDGDIDQAVLMTAAREEFAKLERNFSTTAGGQS